MDGADPGDEVAGVEDVVEEEGSKEWSTNVRDLDACGNSTAREDYGESREHGMATPVGLATHSVCG